MQKSVLKLLHRCISRPGLNFCRSGGVLPNVDLLVGVTRHFQTSSFQLRNKRASDAQDDANADEDDEEKERQKKEARKSALSTQTYFDSKERNKHTFEVMIELFKDKNPNRRGLVEFIYAAIKHMEDYNVSYDLDTYKKLIQILPEGKYVPENIYQEEFYHYPKQQDCILSLLDNMEMKGVCPDKEMVDILKRIFGPKGHPVKKVWRQLYWFPKFKNASPWPVPFPPITDRFALAKLAVERIVSVDPQSVISIHETKSIPDAIDDTFIVSGQSPTQRKLIEEHPTSKSLYVEGAFRIWLGRACVNYFILRADPKKFSIEPQDPDDVTHFNIPFTFETNKKIIKKPSVHEQEDGTILAVCATGSSSRDALLSWIRLLEQNGNPALGKIPVIFSMKSPLGDIVPINNDGPIPQSDEPQKVTGST